MSAEKVIYNLLANDAALVAVVPAARIYPGVIPLNAVLPAIAYNFISGVEQTSIDLETLTERERVQVTVATKTYALQKTVKNLVIAACNHKKGIFNGVKTNSVIKDVVGPDFRDDEAVIFYQTVDFKVTYQP
jgi:hypothetical protein